MQLVLASSSPNRLSLLKSINIFPDQIISPDIDETPFKAEQTDNLIMRLSYEKAAKAALQLSKNSFIIAADTIVGTKSTILDKAYSNEDVLKYLRQVSGKKIYIKTSITILKIVDANIVMKSTKLVCSKVKFKRFSENEIEQYLNSKIGIGVSGGVNIQGFGETLIKSISGSISGIIGLPLYEAINILRGMGYDPFKSKS